jgi:hypothetical protein
VWIMARATEGADSRPDQGDPFLFNPNPSWQRPRASGDSGASRCTTRAAASAIAASAKSLIFGNMNYMGMREARGDDLPARPVRADGPCGCLYYFRTVYKTLQAEAIQYATHPTA